MLTMFETWNAETKFSKHICQNSAEKWTRRLIFKIARLQQREKERICKRLISIIARTRELKNYDVKRWADNIIWNSRVFFD